MAASTITLSQLTAGQRGVVTEIISDGTIRRRMLDLGIINGTEVQYLYKSPSGNPKAFFIRGAVIALRSDVSEKIMVTAL